MHQKVAVVPAQSKLVLHTTGHQVRLFPRKQGSGCANTIAEHLFRVSNRIASDVWVNHFQTSAYLAPVIAACALPTLPRALLIRHHVRLILSFALSYSYSLLAGWSPLKARQHTESPSAPETDYNASAAAVVEVFFIFYFWFMFALKSSCATWQLLAVLAGLYAAAVLPLLAKAESFHIILKSASKDILSATQAISQLTQTHEELLSHVTTARSRDIVTDQESVFVAKMKDSLRVFLGHVNQARTNLKMAEQELAWSNVDNVGLNDINSSISELMPLLSSVVSTVDMLHTARQNEASQISSDQKNKAEKSQNSGSRERQSVQSLHGVRQQLYSYSKTLADEIMQGTKQISDAMNTILRTGKAPRSTARLKKSDATTVSNSPPRAVDVEKTSGTCFQQSTVHPSALHASQMREFLEGRFVLKDLNPPHQHTNCVTFFIAINVCL
jgi:hypothetical protein